MEILSSRVILRPTDYEKTLAFYRDVLELAIAREYPGGTVFFAGQSLIEVAGHAGPATAFGGALWLQVRNLAHTHAELTARGATIVQDPALQPWGLLEMWVHDPDGTSIVFVEVPAAHPLRRDLRKPGDHA